MKNIKKILPSIILIAIFFLSAYSFVKPVSAEDPLKPDTEIQMYTQEGTFLASAGISDSTSVGSVIATIIKTLLGLLGIIFVVLLIYAGFQWMTAEGNEEKVTKAKDTIVRAIIGLVIIIAAYSITYFVFQKLNKAAGGSGTSTERPL
jgi:amino acid transporter